MHPTGWQEDTRDGFSVAATAFFSKELQTARYPFPIRPKQLVSKGECPDARVAHDAT